MWLLIQEAFQRMHGYKVADYDSDEDTRALDP